MSVCHYSVALKQNFLLKQHSTFNTLNVFPDECQWCFELRALVWFLVQLSFHQDSIWKPDFLFETQYWYAAIASVLTNVSLRPRLFIPLLLHDEALF